MPRPSKGPGGWQGNPASVAALIANGYHARPKCAQCGRIAMRNSTLCWHHAGKPRKGEVNNGNSPQGYDIRETLRRLSTDRTVGGHARASAARTLAELDGMIGRHQQPPDRHALTALTALSRTDLVSELERLRASCAADKAQDKV